MNQKITEPEVKIITTAEFMERLRTKTKTLFYPQLGHIVIKSISAEERDEIKSASTDRRTGEVKESTLAIVTIVKGLVDPKLSPADIEELRKREWSLVSKISGEIWTLSEPEKIKND